MSIEPTGGKVILASPDGDRTSIRHAWGEVLGIKYSPLSRKIVTFNLVALCLMMTGILYLNQFDDGLIEVREDALETDARFISEALTFAADPLTSNGTLSPKTAELFSQMTEDGDTYAQLLDAEGNLVTFSFAQQDQAASDAASAVNDQNANAGPLALISSRVARLFGSTPDAPLSAYEIIQMTRVSVASALQGNLRQSRLSDPNGKTLLSVAIPLLENNRVGGAIVMSTSPGEIDTIVSRERGQILRIFFLAIVINVILSMALANTIAHPLQQLAEAAEEGSALDSRTVNPERIEIPDLTGRPDEIGYLAGAMGSMTTALYDRIDANESFAADVAHEIKNPLTSLKSAVDTMKYAKDDAGRAKLLDVIKQDVTRLDRLVTDISNASRLDRELVRDERIAFNLSQLIMNLVEFNQEQAEKQGGRLVSYLPDMPLMVRGLEGRLAQVLVNLISNAISFIDEGGEVRVIAEEIEGDRVRVTVEDTGPGIPNDNLADVFKRFYSERPGQAFGNNSGLGLSISKQIVDAHGGEIYAENIRPEGVGLDVAPDGARFVLDLPV